MAVEKNTPEIKTGFDLYIFRDAKWVIHNSYSTKELEEAQKVAITLRDTGAYIGICLVDHKKKEIIFNHNTRGDRLTYGLIITGGQGFVPQADETQIREAKIVDKTSKEAASSKKNKKLIPLFIALASLTTGAITAKIISENADGVASGNQFMLPVSIVGVGLAVSFILYLKQLKADMHKKADIAEILARKWKDVDGITKESIDEFMKYSKDKNGEMLNDSHFGVILMAIGMGDGFTEHYGLPKEEVEEKIVEFLNKKGISVNAVSRAWQNIYEYLAYPRYQKMYDKGRSIAKTRLESWGADVAIKESVANWLGENSPQEKNDEAKVASVLFTDIVDFTSSHQRHGDDWMVDVVKAHNEIVRTALRSFQGKEVKHTGDGIMASFPSALMATQAAQAMQKGFIRFTEAVPNRAFDVRVGISAGEPIHMGDDIFGTPVNLAARVMSHGNGRDIMLADSAYEICKGADHKFDKVTGCQLKGFDGDHTLYRINCGKEKPKPAIREDIGETFLDPEKPTFSR